MTRYPVTISLGSVLLGVFAVSTWTGTHAAVLAANAVGLQQVLAGDVTVLLSAGFVHADAEHLLMNLFFLAVFGAACEDERGSGTTLLAFLLGVLAGNLSFILLFPAETAVGASGGVYALIGLITVAEPGRPIHRSIDLPIALLGIPYLFTGLIYAPTLQDNTAHIAHLGGAVAGGAAARLRDRAAS